MSSVDAATAWLAQDPDPVTRAELQALIDAGDAAALDDRFGARLAFGTAGLRGALGAGPNRMNRVLVAQAAAGLAAYVHEQGGSSIVIGYDGRRNSDVFARDSAEIIQGAGLTALLLPRLLPTPVLAFAVRHLGADAGVMVTASHNPPNDNGYKVYLGGADDGSQIVPPADSEIAAHIARVADTLTFAGLPKSDAYTVADESVVDAYIAATASVAPATHAANGMNWVYTAMHGVGWQTFSRVLEVAGYPQPQVVAEQVDPDGRFPTVAFPNPEEPGAMDLAFAKAQEVGAEFIIANDPDADRLAVGIPTADGWRRLTGNEIGLLLGQRAALRQAQRPEGASGSLACSLVSSPALGLIAAKHGLDFHTTLTGFKWISRAPGLVFGFEEALGYLVNPETVRDKDGISAAVAILSLAADARERGTTIQGLLDELQAEIGFVASGQVSLRVDDLSIIARLMQSLRTDAPAAFGEQGIATAEDLLDAPAGEPNGDILRYTLEDSSRVIVRPSGTEPKLKAYLDVTGTSAADAQHRLSALEQSVHQTLTSRSS
ncbi:MAG: phospho-sugar mutase [Microbacterium sp.]